MSNSTCASCSAPLSGRGPKANVTGDRFCMKRACQNERQRRYRDTLRGQELTLDERPCYCCGIELLARPTRATDSAVGRWCPRQPCQRDRAARVGLDKKLEAGVFGVEEMTQMAILFRQAKDQRGRVPCRECGLEDAVPGYGHPRPDGQGGCRALGLEKLSPDEARFTWPDLFD